MCKKIPFWVCVMNKIPDQKELEKELSDYLSRKYGDRIKVVSPIVYPKEDMDDYATGEGAVGKKGLSKIAFDMKPEELDDYLNQYVVKQDEAKAILATKVCTHFNRIKYLKSVKKEKASSTVGYIKSNIIMIGPTGVGKTYVIRLIAQKIGVPFVKGDATKFSETGYVGGDVEDLVRDLVHEANDDMELAHYGIIYIDEIDKIASSGHIIGPDVSRTGVQRALLKPMEETEVDLKVPHDPISQLQAIERYRKTGKRDKRTINTKNILFILSGAFNELEDIIRKRLHKQKIGFGAGMTSREERINYLKEVKAEDLIEYGFESEFVGRLPVVAVFDELTEDDLYQILRNPNNPIISAKKSDFRAYGIDIRFEDEALRLLAKKAYHERTGARGLVSTVEKVLLKFEKTLPSRNIKQFAVTTEVVEDPEKELKKLLENPNDPGLMARYQEISVQEVRMLNDVIRNRKNEFLQKYRLTLTKSRIDIIANLCMDNEVDVATAFQEIFDSYSQIRKYEDTFYERCAIRLNFNDEAIDEIMTRALAERVKAHDVCEKSLKNLEFGLKLIWDKTGRDQFSVTKEAIVDPDSYINKLIKGSYGHLD